ncbi:NAD-dependent epimerase/dehydratase family protein [Agromyces intestinalis]|uniref:NAD-dependent epimerase/dehydratase family protein n=1 Tax=Agromyces intestinalis TaxID=2592652 RepID=A0A5C1YIS3_9MICO|nr:NAD-dependent epimerase/dehydratase family protein [Agromyces intestinalis]QEO14957.1 NAD-dependent epimerase/dehydratase family protein [Agromyces intestinalis]
MTSLLTGATGYLGSAVLDRLVASGYDVVAVVRSPGSAERVTARGARALVGDLTDVAWLTAALADADGAIHLAAPSDGAAALNEAVVDAAIAAYAGTGRRFVLTSGIWEFGAGDLDDDGPLDPPELVAWRVPIEQRLLASDVDAAIVAPGLVYGHGRGLISLITDAPRTESGALTLVGDGEQHWSWVHVDDLARLYELVLVSPAASSGVASGRIVAVDGAPLTVRALGEAVAGEAGVAGESADASRARLGAVFADALLLDQRASGRKARELGWIPEHPSVLEEVERQAAAA